MVVLVPTSIKDIDTRYLMNASYKVNRIFLPPDEVGGI